eukprot:TRINITY_DN20775_c0_g1_i1.p1 TRINITY_DN20775_c0_g1~~TRINITY_DN20775_c0_g1_i1.p1  ORF type:complete len:322 (-),score=51.84 TRINITY_DN20775_c0_g1_i1:47-958(-)
MACGRKRRGGPASAVLAATQMDSPPVFESSTTNSVAPCDHATVPEDDSERACWICLGSEQRDRAMGTMRSPCACKGSLGYVHENCLQEWTTTKVEDGTPGMPCCPTCNMPYTGDVVLLLAAGSALRLSLCLPRLAESRLIAELQNRKMNREASALLRRCNRWNIMIADPTHSVTMQGLCNVAAAMREVKQLESAVVLWRRVMRNCESLGGGRKRRGWRRALWEFLETFPLLTRLHYDQWQFLARRHHFRPDGEDWEDEDVSDMMENRYEWSRIRAIGQSAAEALAETLEQLGCISKNAGLGSF